MASNRLAQRTRLLARPLAMILALPLAGAARTAAGKAARHAGAKLLERIAAAGAVTGAAAAAHVGAMYLALEVQRRVASACPSPRAGGGRRLGAAGRRALAVARASGRSRSAL
jgi:hypothetical protein